MACVREADEITAKLLKLGVGKLGRLDVVVVNNAGCVSQDSRR